MKYRLAARAQEHAGCGHLNKHCAHDKSCALRSEGISGRISLTSGEFYGAIDIDSGLPAKLYTVIG
jgi:hypothetical protein